MFIYTIGDVIGMAVVGLALPLLAVYGVLLAGNKFFKWMAKR